MSFRFASLLTILVVLSASITGCSGGVSAISPTTAKGSARTPQCVPSIVNNTCTSPSTPKPVPWPGFTNPIADGNFVNAEANFWDVATGSGFAGSDLPGFWYSCAEDETTHLIVNTPLSTTTTTQAPGGPSTAGVAGPMTVINMNDFPMVSGLNPWSAQIGSTTYEAPRINGDQVLYGICYDFTVPATSSNLNFWAKQVTNNPLQVAGPGVTLKGYQTAAILPRAPGAEGPVAVGSPFPAPYMLYQATIGSPNENKGWVNYSYTLEEFRGDPVTVFFGVDSPGAGTSLEQLIAGVSVPAATPPPVTMTLYAVAPVEVSNGDPMGDGLVYSSANQQLLEYQNLGSGTPTLIQSITLPAPTAPTGPILNSPQNGTEIFLAPNGAFWYVGLVSGAQVLITCTVAGTVCVAGSAPTSGINNPQAVAVESTGRLAVLNGDSSIAVFAAGATASSTPTVIAASNPALAGNGPAHLGFDPAGNLWVDTQTGGMAGPGGVPVGVGDLIEFAPGASGQTPPMKRISTTSPGVMNHACPFAINIYGQIWVDCNDGNFNYVFNFSESSGTLTAAWWASGSGPGEPAGGPGYTANFSLPSQITTDATNVYFSDSVNASVFVFPNAALGGSLYTDLSGFPHQGGIAL